MKKIYSFLFLILFITTSLASDDEDYYDDMMDELLGEGRKLLGSVYYNPSATYPFQQTSESRILTAIGKPTAEDSDDKDAPKVLGVQTIPDLTRAVPDRTLFDFLNDGKAKKP